MDYGKLLIDQMIYTIEDAHRDTDRMVCFDVRSILTPLHDKALLDDDSEEDLFFFYGIINGQFSLYL